MQARTLATVGISAAIAFSCATREKVIAREVTLSNDPLTIQPEQPWSAEGSDLQLCVEPTVDYSRQVGSPSAAAPGHFINPEGEAIELNLRLVAPQGAHESIRPSQFYLTRNLACFSLSARLEPNVAQLELRSVPPIDVERVYWYWYFYH